MVEEMQCRSCSGPGCRRFLGRTGKFSPVENGELLSRSAEPRTCHWRRRKCSLTSRKCRPEAHGSRPWRTRTRPPPPPCASRASEEPAGPGWGCEGERGAGPGRAAPCRATAAPGQPPLRFNGALPRVSFPSSYAATRKIEPFYKGGRIQVMPALQGHRGRSRLLALTFPIPFLQISRDGKFMFCPCGSKVNVVDVETGALLHSLQQVTGIGLS